MFYKIFILFIISLYTTSSFAGDIKAIKTNSSFEEIAHIDQLEKISVNQMPVTAYTPKNLKSQQELRFQGRNTSNGAMTVWSTTLTDYDTKVVESKEENGEYYIIDNTGKQIKTGEHFDLEPINSSLETIRGQINQSIIQINTLDEKVLNNSSELNNLNKNVSNHESQLKETNNKIKKTDDKVNKNIQQLNTINEKLIYTDSQIIDLNEKINLNTSYLNKTTVQIENQNKQINVLNQRINKLERKLDSSLATASAIGSLKSNPRSNSKGELAIGIGSYRDTTAIATGLIYHYNNNVMITGGISHTNPNVTVGFGGITFSLF